MVFYEYSWANFDRDVKNLAKKIQLVFGKDWFLNVYGIPRGGLPVAVCLSHLLKIPLILDEKEIGQRTLLCDDIFDTGRTITALLERLGFKPKIATLFVRSRKIPEVITVNWLDEKSDIWIIFPWETIETTR